MIGVPARKKDPSVRARANTASTATTLPRSNGRARVPALPRLPAGDTWHPAAREWWAELWRSPMAREYLEVDRRALELLAVLENDFWTATTPAERTKAATEIRLQRRDFGLTPYYRRRLEWTVSPDDDPDGGPGGRRRSRARGVKQPSARDDPRRALHAVT